MASIKNLFKRFMGSINEEIRSDFEKLSKMQFTKNDEYDIIEDEEDIDTEIDATVNTNYLADNID